MTIQHSVRAVLATLLVLAAVPAALAQNAAPKPDTPAAASPAPAPPSPRAATPAPQGMAPAGQAASAEAPADPELSGIVQTLERFRVTVEQIENSLRSPDIGDATLVQHRGAINPVRDGLREIIASLDQRLADLDNRLKQLGDAPPEGETKEEPALAAERAQLQERRGPLDAAAKQARLIMLGADDVSTRITERRRALFTNRLLGRSASALDPAFWVQVGRSMPDAVFGARLVGQGWRAHLGSNATAATIGAAAAASLAFFAIAVLVLRWFRRRDVRSAARDSRFAKSSLALLALLRVALVAPLLAGGVLLILAAFDLLTERVIAIGWGLTVALAVAAFGRGVAIGLFAPDDPDRRLLALTDGTAGLAASTLTWAGRILGLVILVNVVLQTIVAPVVLTVATNALFAAAIAALLCRFLFVLVKRDTADDEASGAGWLRAAGWLLSTGIFVALVTGYIGLAAFLAGRFLVALGLIGALYILLTFIDALFTETLTASTPRGQAVAKFFGVKPRSIELFGTLLSAVIRVLLVLVIVMPLLGPWGIFAADFFGVIREASFGFRIGDITISFATIFGAVAIVVVGILATRAVQAWLNTTFLPRTAIDPSLQNSVSTILGYVGVIAAVSLALAYLGVDFQRITLVAGALSIGIGFGLQSVVSNFVSGLILLAERPIRVGDIIAVRGEEGRVRRIHVRATEIETGDRASVIIPNSELITQVVKNRTHTDTFARVSVQLGVAYDSDVVKVREILLGIVREHPHIMQNPGPSVFLTGFGESAINFEVGWVVRNLGDGASIKNDVCFAILERFRAEGIVMPYPQRGIHIDNLGEASGEDGAPARAVKKKPKAK
ncbi:MAG: DUF3772 domain-containing protein [Pseudorhodoplanes sp.]